MANVYIFTHSDLDGAASAVLLHLVYGAQVQAIKFCNYDNIDKELTDFLDKIEKNKISKDIFNHRLFITDISPSDKLLKRLDQTPHLAPFLLDHHKTKEKSLSKYSWAKFNKDLCGAELVLDFLNTSEGDKIGRLFSDTEKWVEAVSAWDMWKLDSKYRERGKQLNTICSFIGLEAFVAKFTNNINSDQSEEFQSILTYLEKNKTDYVNKIIGEQLRKTNYIMDGLGQTFKIIFASEYISELGQAALYDDDSEDLHYIVIVNPLTNTLSFRSREEDPIDVSVVAKRLGGGGHKAASGAIINLKNGLQNKISKILNMIDG